MELSRAIELLSIEKACVERASGFRYSKLDDKLYDTGMICKRNCEECPLVQDEKDLLEMYEMVIEELKKSLRDEKDLLEMYGNSNLQEQESAKREFARGVKPKFIQGVPSCGNCRNVLANHYKNCPWCGCEVNWDEQ